jgi:hypothetical protein
LHSEGDAAETDLCSATSPVLAWARAYFLAEIYLRAKANNGPVQCAIILLLSPTGKQQKHTESRRFAVRLSALSVLRMTRERALAVQVDDGAGQCAMLLVAGPSLEQTPPPHSKTNFAGRQQLCGA